jgi:NADPH:quinone reductase-like Zn-dependent oxidoreductase
VIYDAVAGALSDKLAQAIKIQGHWIVYGVLDAENLGTFPWWTAFMRSFHFHAYKVFNFTGNRHRRETSYSILARKGMSAIVALRVLSPACIVTSLRRIYSGYLSSLRMTKNSISQN